MKELLVFMIFLLFTGYIMDGMKDEIEGYELAAVEIDKTIAAIVESRPEIKEIRCIKIAKACDFSYLRTGR